MLWVVWIFFAACAVPSKAHPSYQQINENLQTSMFENDFLGDASMTKSLFNTFMPSRNIEECQIHEKENEASSLPHDDIFNIKPSDIKVVIAFGDSITAGFGLNSTSLIFNPMSWKEFRGHSFSMGGDKGANSIANFIAHYHKNDNIAPFQQDEEQEEDMEETYLNLGGFFGDENMPMSAAEDSPFLEEEEKSFPYYSNVYPSWNPFARRRDIDANINTNKRPLGASRGKRFVRMCLRGWCPPFSWLYSSKVDNLNAAISGSKSDALSKQFVYINNQLKKLANQTNIDLSAEWKMVTLFIGMNDLCVPDCEKAFPENPNSPRHPKTFKKQVMDLMEQISENYPKTIVNIVQLLDVSPLDLWTRDKERCSNVNWLRKYLCPCCRSEFGREILKERMKVYNEMLEDVWKAYTVFDIDRGVRVPLMKDFAVILSPQLTEINLERDVPIEFISKLDCFHLSLLGHQTLAIAIWNDLFRPLAEKHRELQYPLNLYCPSADDRIQVV